MIDIDASRERLTEEQKERTDEETDLCRTLEAAGVQALTTNEPSSDSAEPPDSEDGAENADGTEEDEEDSVIKVITKDLCKHCGQVVEVGPCTLQTEADETAAWACKCAKAIAARRMLEQIADAQERVNRLFGNGAVGLCFKPVAGEGVIEVRGQCMAKFSVTSKGKIKVSRSEPRSCNLEVGE